MRAERIFPLMTALARRVADTIVPPRCVACRAELAADACLCGDCWARLALIEEPSCPATGLPLTGEWAETLASLPASAQKRPWESLHAAVFHDGPGRALVHALKFHDDHAPARLMARLMARRVRKLARERRNLLVTPVPLHRRRLWWRRFNQSALLARALARELGLAFIPDLLVRRRYTTPQTRLSGRERRRNLKGAFAVNARHAARLQGRPVLLVDDVLTTGATARACTRTLLEAGAGSVHVVVFALAEEPRALHI
jgi:ComF family protein